MSNITHNWCQVIFQVSVNLLTYAPGLFIALSVLLFIGGYFLPDDGEYFKRNRQ
jgi:hypothetical protein